ncbi:ATP-grasp domain-containing protein [Sorangium sp. So ce145]|uniref:ATP-grasp domain-containing protein n=1 Tax=Sorangium sp. So ce145 TaxID=3133285 RepID=UPI003F5D6E72
MTSILLVMRKGYGIHGDHIETLRRLGLSVHLLTEVPQAADDPRFASVIRIPPAERESAVDRAIEYCRAHGISLAVTFQETDIEVWAAINAALGASTASPAAAAIARDKSRQRRFLAEHGLPTPAFLEVVDVEQACIEAEHMGFPLIVKPTRAASSMHVTLATSTAELRSRLTAIETLARSGAGNYYAGKIETFALLEEFLPGDEVTLDGVVIDGELHLGGIHNKMRMPGPFFEEDLYSLPFKRPEEEAGLFDIADRICRRLDLRRSLFNVELRKDAGGAYRVVEFSPRVSGGHVYRNIRDVYSIDLVAAHVASCVPARSGLVEHALRRSAPRMATCIKFVYRSGRVVENHSGPASLSESFVAYFPTARPGAIVRAAPRGFDITGLLSVKGLYRGPGDIERVEHGAGELEGALGLVIVNEAP